MNTCPLHPGDRRSTRSLDVVAAGDPEYTVLATRWDRHWQLFILDPVEGLRGTVDALTQADIETAARYFLSDLLRRPARTFRITIVQR